MKQPSADHPLCLLVHDGELGDVRALLEAICFAVLRSRARSEAALAAWMAKPLGRGDNELRALLHVGFAQVVVMGLPAHAALSATVRNRTPIPVFSQRSSASRMNSAIRGAYPSGPPSMTWTRSGVPERSGQRRSTESVLMTSESR